METLFAALEYRADETRESPGLLAGVLMAYGTRANDRPELFEDGAFHWRETGIVIREQHNRAAPIVRAMPYLEGRELRVNVPVAEHATRAGRRYRHARGNPAVLWPIRRIQQRTGNPAERVARDNPRVPGRGQLGRHAILPIFHRRGTGRIRPIRSTEHIYMAVTITRADLAARIRLGRTPTELNEADQILAYATEAVTRHAPNAPDVIHDEAVFRMAGYIYDRPFASADTRFSNVLRNSGAASALLPYRMHGAGGGTAETPAGGGVAGALGTIAWPGL